MKMLAILWHHCDPSLPGHPSHPSYPSYPSYPSLPSLPSLPSKVFPMSLVPYIFIFPFNSN